MRKKLFPMVLIALMAAWTTSATAGTNNFAADMQSYVSTNRYHMHLETEDKKGWNFRPLLAEKYGDAAERNAVGTFELPAARLRWMSAGFNGYGAHEAYASAGRSLFVSSLRRGGRDALAEYLPTDEWADWASHLFKWSLGESAQGELAYGKAAPSAADLVWWRNNADGPLQYGIDPWNADAYFRATIGHSGRDSIGGDRPILVIGGRYEYDPITQGRFKAQLVIPLFFSWQFDASCSLDGKTIAALDSSSFSYAGRIEKLVGRGMRFKSLLYVGVQSNHGFLSAKDRGDGPVAAAGFMHPF